MAKKRRFKKRARPSFRGFRYKRLYSRFEALYKLLAMLGVSALLSSVVYAVIYRSVEGYAAPIAVLFGKGGLLFGYGMSAFWGTVTSCERVRSEYSYERLDSYFDKGVLFLSALTAALACFGVYKVAYGLSGTVTASGLVLRDSADMLPAVVTAVFGGCLLCGVLLWFIPYNKVISVGNAIPLGLVFFIVMLMS